MCINTKTATPLECGTPSVEPITTTTTTTATTTTIVVAEAAVIDQRTFIQNNDSDNGC